MPENNKSGNMIILHDNIIYLEQVEFIKVTTEYEDAPKGLVRYYKIHIFDVLGFGTAIRYADIYSALTAITEDIIPAFKKIKKEIPHIQIKID